ncbi:MAG: hypothetical protein KBT47_05935 [Armatimonadetes bacterium]|nr:hypothetical protein [Candidatus Hippobium faecium]
MDISNYSLDKEAFENNLGAFYYAKNKNTGKQCVILKLNKTLKNEKFLAQVSDYVKKDKPSVENVLFIKNMFAEDDEYYAEYESFEGKPISFIMSQSRKSPEIKKMIASVAKGLDGMAEAGISYGGLTAESVIRTADGKYVILGAEFYNTEIKLEGNEDLYASGYTDPKVSDYKYSQKSDVYSLGRFTATMFLAEKFYTGEYYAIPDIPQLKPIQASIDQAIKTEERFDTCKAFADSLSDFKGTCPFTDHGSQIATYWYVAIVVILIVLDVCADKFGFLSGLFGG